MKHRAAPERTDSFPLIVALRGDQRPTPLRHRARRDIDGSYRIRRDPRRRFRRRDLRILAIAPENDRSGGMRALLAVYAVVAAVILIGVGGAWLDMVLR